MSFVGDVLGGLIGSNASENAVDAQERSADQANATQRYMYDTTRADNAPLLQTRDSALNRIKALLSNPASVAQQPDYQFGFDQGTRALNAGASARGMTYSGAQGKALTRYGNDYAGSKLDQFYNRLSNLAGLGQVGANNNLSAGQNYANNVSANQIGLGNAKAAGSLYRGSTYGNAINSLAAYGDRNGWFGGSGGSGGNTYD